MYLQEIYGNINKDKYDAFWELVYNIAFQTKSGAMKLKMLEDNPADTENAYVEFEFEWDES